MNFKISIVLINLFCNLPVSAADSQREISHNLAQVLLKVAKEHSDISELPALSRALFNNQFKSYVDSAPPEQLFNDIREYSKSIVSVGLTLDQSSEQLSKLYGVVFNKLGGADVLNSITNVDPSNAPIIVKAAYNKAINLYKLGKFQEAYTIFNVLELKGYTPAVKPAEACAKELKKNFKESQKIYTEEIKKLADFTSGFQQFAEKITSPEIMGDVLESITHKVMNEMIQESLSAPEGSRALLENPGVLEEYKQSIVQKMKDNMLSPKVAELREQLRQRIKNTALDPLENAAKLATSGDLKGVSTALIKISKTLDDERNPVKEILPEDLFASDVLEELGRVSKTIYNSIDSLKDSIFFVGRSPLYISRMLQSLYPEFKGVFEVPFSYKVNNINLLDEKGKQKYQEAEAHYADFLRRTYEPKMSQGGKIYAIDLYESGESLNKFCDFLENALNIQPQIIALVYPEKNLQNARVAEVISLSFDCVMQMRANDNVKGLDASHGMPFSWGEWANWETTMGQKPQIGGVARARLEQIEEFASIESDRKLPLN